MAKRRKKKVGWKGQVFFIVLLFLCILFSSMAIVMVIGMIPSIVAWITDRTEGRIRTLTVSSMNFAGCVPFLVEIYKTGNNIETAVSYITQPETIVVMYFAAGMGYLIDWAMTGIVSSIMVQKTKKRLSDILKEQKELTERWGHEVSGTVPLDEFGFPRDDSAAKAEEQQAL